MTSLVLCCQPFAQVVKMVNRMNELKEKQDPGSTKKEKDAKKDLRVAPFQFNLEMGCYAETVAESTQDSKKKTPLSAEEQKEFAQLQNEIEIYKVRSTCAKSS